jgi:putative transport protein
MIWLHELFEKSPEIALFLSLAIGYAIGKVSFGKFQLGGVAGSLLAAVLISQVGVQIDNGVKALLFALFIYAVGYESGPRFFSSLGRQSLREIVLAAVLALVSLATVLLMAKWMALDAGLAAGIAAGGLTQSAIIGTASEAIGRLPLSVEEIKQLQSHVAVGYAVTYVFGSFGAIIVCANILPKLMGTSLRDDARKAEVALQVGAPNLGQGQQLAAPDIVGRVFRVMGQKSMTVAQAEALDPSGSIAVERIKRGRQVIKPSPDFVFQAGDAVLVMGRRAALVTVTQGINVQEIPVDDDMTFVIVQRMVLLDNKNFDNKTLGQLQAETAPALRRGVYLLGVRRMGVALPVALTTVVKQGDELTLYGAESDVLRVTQEVGYPVVLTQKTDFVYLGAGLVAGLLLGLVSVRLGGLPLTLGSGGGALLSGLLFGWVRAKRQTFGAMPEAAVQILKDLGLAGFVVVVGLNSGLQAVMTVREQGLSLFMAGVVVTLVPLLMTMLIGRYVLRYDNAAIFAGALSGARSANPAFGEVLNKAGNSVPTVPFAITYALANVFLTLLGPLIVALV